MSSNETNKYDERLKVLYLLRDRECACDKSKCAEHFMYIDKLIYEYETEGITTDDRNGSDESL